MFLLMLISAGAKPAQVELVPLGRLVLNTNTNTELVCMSSTPSVPAGVSPTVMGPGNTFPTTSASLSTTRTTPAPVLWDSRSSSAVLDVHARQEPFLNTNIKTSAANGPLSVVPGSGDHVPRDARRDPSEVTSMGDRTDQPGGIKRHDQTRLTSD